MENLKIGEKITKVPLIQGGMGVGISLGRLAGSVAKAGGIGVISTAQIGYREPDFDKHPEEANLRAIGKEMQKARQISENGIIGYNIMTALKGYADHVKAAVKAGADLIISGAGLPVDLPALTEGSAVKIAPIVSTARSAQVILKYWDKKYGRTADLIVAEGPLAGGHLGFTEAELDKWKGDAYHMEFGNILDVVRQYAKKYKCRIPVIAAGGIYDRSDVQRMEQLGADGVQVATRFVTTKECDAHRRYKEAYLKAVKDEIDIVKSPVGMPGRAIMTKLTKRLKQDERIPVKRCYNCLIPCDVKTTPYCISGALINAAKGNLDEGLVFSGSNGYRNDKIISVKELMDELKRGLK